MLKEDRSGGVCPDLEGLEDRSGVCGLVDVTVSLVLI